MSIVFYPGRGRVTQKANLFHVRREQQVLKDIIKRTTQID